MLSKEGQRLALARAKASLAKVSDAADELEAAVARMSTQTESGMHAAFLGVDTLLQSLRYQQNINRSRLTRGQKQIEKWGNNWVKGLDQTSKQLKHEAYMFGDDTIDALAYDPRDARLRDSMLVEFAPVSDYAAAAPFYAHPLLADEPLEYLTIQKSIPDPVFSRMDRMRTEANFVGRTTQLFSVSIFDAEGDEFAAFKPEDVEIIFKHNDSVLPSKHFDVWLGEEVGLTEDDPWSFWLRVGVKHYTDDWGEHVGLPLSTLRGVTVHVAVFGIAIASRELMPKVDLRSNVSNIYNIDLDDLGENGQLMCSFGAHEFAVITKHKFNQLHFFDFEENKIIYTYVSSGKILHAHVLNSSDYILQKAGINISEAANDRWALIITNSTENSGDFAVTLVCGRRQKAFIVKDFNDDLQFAEEYYEPVFSNLLDATNYTRFGDDFLIAYYKQTDATGQERLYRLTTHLQNIGIDDSEDEDDVLDDERIAIEGVDAKSVRSVKAEYRHDSRNSKVLLCTGEDDAMYGIYNVIPIAEKIPVQGASYFSHLDVGADQMKLAFYLHGGGNVNVGVFETDTGVPEFRYFVNGYCVTIKTFDPKLWGTYMYTMVNWSVFCNDDVLYVVIEHLNMGVTNLSIFMV